MRSSPMRSAVSVPRVQVGRDGTRIELVVDGVVQSVNPESVRDDDYWGMMLPDLATRRALILGAGGGTLAALLRRRAPDARIVAIDADHAVIAAGRRELHLEAAGIDVVLADAFLFAAGCPARFDYVAVDLFVGAVSPPETLAKPFLRNLRRLTAPGGTIVFNRFRGRRVDREITRLAAVLGVPRRVDSGNN